jgi:hypothetical protein
VFVDVVDVTDVVGGGVVGILLSCECVLKSVCYFRVPFCRYLYSQSIASEAASARWTSKILVSCEQVRPSRQAQRTPKTIDRVPALQRAATTTTQSIRHEYLARLRQPGVFLVGVTRKFTRALTCDEPHTLGPATALWSFLRLHFDCRHQRAHPHAHSRKHRTT